jgi:hypothetical protein
MDNMQGEAIFHFHLSEPQHQYVKELGGQTSTVEAASAMKFSVNNQSVRISFAGISMMVT